MKFQGGVRTALRWSAAIRSGCHIPREIQGGKFQGGVKRTVTRHVGDSSARRTIRAVAALAMHPCQAAPAEA